MMLTCLKPAQSLAMALWASRNSCSRPGLTRKRTALNAVIGTPVGWLTRNDAREGRLEARAWVAAAAYFGPASSLLKWRCHATAARKVPMSDNSTTTPRTKSVTKTKRPPLHKVILLNDDYTPREFVIVV